VLKLVHRASENCHFRGQKGFQNLIPTPLNPLEFAAGQFHLRPMAICLQQATAAATPGIEVTKV
jgi:hypothetical protein